MTKAVALALAAASWIIKGIAYLIAGGIFSATVMATHIPDEMQQAQRICLINGGNFLMELGGVPEGMKGWRCYNVFADNKTPTWVGPDILARRLEDQSGWQVFEDVEEQS